MKITSLLVLLVSTYASFAQTLSNKGREFYVGYGHHQFMEMQTTAVPKNGQEMVLYFSTEGRDAHVTVSVNGTAYSEPYTVPANSVIQSKPIPKGLPSSSYDFRLYTRPPTYGGTFSEGLFTKHGIHIESDVPIIVYAHIYGNQASGSTMLMPVDTWGYSYVSMNTRQIYNTNGARDCFSWVYVIAKENNTRVRIIPLAATRGGQAANVPIDVDLQKGEIYQLLGASITDDEAYDLTGTTVTSIANSQGKCYPIAVFSGSSRTAISCNDDKNGGDNLIQQLFPSQAWGKHYLTAPTSVDASAQTNNINVYRIIVKDPRTIVKKNGMRLFGLRGFYYEYQSDQADYIEADQPIQVAQYIPTAGYCSSTGNGDPELMLISPMEQAIKQTGFYRNTQEKIDVNYLTLIIPTNGLKTLTIDGVTNAYSYSYPHPNLAGYTVVVKRWRAEQKQCVVQSDSAFTGITYGIGVAETYGYNVGTMINNLSGMPFLRNLFNPNPGANLFTCLNTPVQLSVLLRYQPTRLQWKLSALKDTITPAIDVDTPPVLAGMETVNGNSYYKYTLPQTYMFTIPGIHKITVLATHASVENCTNTEEIPYVVEVREALKTDFDINYTNCQPSANVQFKGQQKFMDSTSIYSWKWTLADTKDTIRTSGKDVTQNFNAGAYTARLTAISSEGCVADTTKPFALSTKPVTPLFDWTALPCEGEKVTFTDKTTEAGVAKWFWDFGNKDTSTTNTYAPKQKLFTSYGEYTVKHVTQFPNGCSSDTAQQIITIYAKPTLTIQYPGSCLKDGVVQFKSLSAAADGQAMNPAGYRWDFGDSEASASNSNTSTLADPSHRFGANTYTISYSASTVNGCKKDTILKTTFNIQPQLTYAALPNICETVTGTLSVANAAITNGVGGLGIYKGKATDATGHFTPSIAGPGKHTIWYIYTSTGGCSDSISQTLTVYPKPLIDAGASFVVPMGETIRFQAQATDSLKLSYQWSPVIGLSDPRILQPSLVVVQDQQYVLTATNEYDCQASDFLRVKILRQLKVPNVFSPNGDGINDRWEIVNLADYSGATVQVFNRYGQLVFSSIGYTTPWDGRQNGKPLPIGTYYYVIDCKDGSAPVSGAVTILK
ncbi:gliding motility-associated C-terminal domain-containing protein [Flavisolibacter tropicus]|nr:gliding motility-associated C-terminal domain-containing protein [Flavisolibacter tropicus]